MNTLGWLFSKLNVNLIERPYKDSPALVDITDFSSLSQVYSKYAYSASFELPKEGFWSAFFVEFEFVGPDAKPIVMTTETMVIPDVIPWDGCWENQRRRKLYNCTKEYERRFF